jgi:hypothetical protein
MFQGVIPVNIQCLKMQNIAKISEIYLFGVEFPAAQSGRFKLLFRCLLDETCPFAGFLLRKGSSDRAMFWLKAAATTDERENLRICVDKQADKNKGGHVKVQCLAFYPQCSAAGAVATFFSAWLANNFLAGKSAHRDGRGA